MDENPAHALADLLTSWDPTGSTPWAARADAAGKDASTLDIWVTQSRAAVLLHQIHDELMMRKAAGRSIRGWELYLPLWYEAVFSRKQEWDRPQYGPVLDEAVLAGLHAYGDNLEDERRSQGSQFSSSRVAGLTSALDDLRDQLISSEQFIAPDELSYILALVDALKAALADHEAGSWMNLREHTDRLTGALMDLGVSLYDEGHPDEAATFTTLAIKVTRVSRGVLQDVANLAGVAGGVMLAIGATG